MSQVVRLQPDALVWEVKTSFCRVRVLFVLIYLLLSGILN